MLYYSLLSCFQINRTMFYLHILNISSNFKCDLNIKVPLGLQNKLKAQKKINKAHIFYPPKKGIFKKNLELLTDL